MIRRPPRSTLSPTRRSSDLIASRDAGPGGAELGWDEPPEAPPGPAVVSGNYRQAAGPVAGDHLEPPVAVQIAGRHGHPGDRKSTRLNSSHLVISYAVFCLKK